jgi:type I restriction enzyme S subunit
MCDVLPDESGIVLTSRELDKKYNTQMINNQNVPKLRFKEFSGEWKEKKLGEVVEIIGGGTPETSKEEYWNGNIQWFTPTEIKSDYVTKSLRTISELGLKKSSAKILPIGAILLTTRATIGEVAIALNECATNQGFQSLVVKNNNNNIFIFNWIKAHKYELTSKANGSTFPEISKSEIEKITIQLPSSIEEQTKIATFLTAIDTKIEQLTKKQTLLKQYKKGVMQKLFSQELRFKADDGSEFSDWEEKKLGEIATFTKGKGISKADITQDGSIECVTYGELYTTYSEAIRDIKSKTNLGANQLVLSEYNDVLIPASGETQIDIATASCILKSNVALGGDLNIIKSKMNGVFLSYYLNNDKKNDIAKLAQGVSVVHLYATQLKTLQLILPSLDEQIKIADFILSIDAKINLVIKQLDATKQFKKALLQQMFV